tara:strand:+ start:3566 stop:4180 length:615 start_codon:yes stop_codon:yes gene_type:complete
MRSNILEFERFKIKTHENVFSPRHDIGIYSEALKGIIKKNNKILELGTGTGAISISLAKSFNSISILATDINPYAIKIAKQNARINEVEGIISFKKSNWFSDIPIEKYDFIVTNPPYLSKKNSVFYSSLSDPRSSLYAENNGLEDIFSIMKNSINYLNLNSYLIIEHSHNQTLFLKNYGIHLGLKFVKSQKDDLGFNRILILSN